MQKYILTFAVSYFLIMLVCAAVLFLLNLKISKTAFTTIATMAASFICAASFDKNEQRLPDHKEKTNFALGATLISVVISLAAGALLIVRLMEQDTQALIFRYFSTLKGVAFMLSILMILVIIQFLVSRWAFGWYSKRAAEDRIRL